MDKEDELRNRGGARIHLHCGCSPHQGADMDRIQGCPVIFANDTLDENVKLKEKVRQFTGLVRWMQKIIDNVPLIGFSEIKVEDENG